jgi:hypothetical protein
MEARMKLTKEEKNFIACFVENGYTIFKPKYKNYISLYSYLDATDETPQQQVIQIERDDPYFVTLLRSFSGRHLTPKHKIEALSEVYEELELGGFFENKMFKERFDVVAKWLSNSRSLEFLDDARRNRLVHFDVKRKAASSKREKIEKELIHQNYIKNKDVFDKNYKEAMLKLAKNQFKKPTTEVVQKRSVTDQWGRQKFTKVEDDGNWWREQE